jgi:hypothetical protein
MKRAQMTIYLTPEVADRLRLASEVAGVPVGRHVGDMLESLIDSVEYVSGKMAEARREPAKALNRVRAIDNALSVDVRQKTGVTAAGPAVARPQGRGRTSAGSATPPSNTGVTSTSARCPGRG